MKQEWWEKKLREDAEVRIQDTDKDWNESYLRPDSSQFLPGNSGPESWRSTARPQRPPW